MMLGPPNLQFSWPVLHGCKMAALIPDITSILTQEKERKTGGPKMLHTFYKERQSISYAPSRSPLASHWPVQSLNDLSTPCIKEGDQSRSLEISVELDKTISNFLSIT